jgi:hypothetical protein
VGTPSKGVNSEYHVYYRECTAQSGNVHSSVVECFACSSMMFPLTMTMLLIGGLASTNQQMDGCASVLVASPRRKPSRVALAEEDIIG